MADYLFVTGKLAAAALTSTLHKMLPEFEYAVEVLNISVAALMTSVWIGEHLPDARGCRHVIVPGLCQGDLAGLQNQLGVAVSRGPNDMKDLPAYFGHEQRREGYGKHRVKILAEIVDAYRMSWEEILAAAEYFKASGADIIDLGCPTLGGFPKVDKVVGGLKERGFMVSLDSFDPDTILAADEGGIDLLLSLNSTNLELAHRLHCKVVVIPDFDAGLESLERNSARLHEWGVRHIMDPILDPIGFGFSDALHRFYETRRRYPDAELLMGLGNLTELTDADSVGINALMAGIITELEIDYVLTTEVISWTRGAVRELDLARKLMHYARSNSILPKHIDDSLIIIKDPPFEPFTEVELRQMHDQLRDNNFRIFADHRWIYVFNRDIFVRGSDPGQIFARLEVEDASHAFYLGRELERASLAVRLGKKYIQESDLRWGYLSDTWKTA